MSDPEPVQSTSSLTGTSLGRYRLERWLGEGGMGVVYAARHQDLGKLAAVKILNERYGEAEQARARFLREGQAAARIRHPNIVDVYDVGVESGRAYLVMELLEGEDLRSLIMREGPLSAQRTADLLVPVVSALAAAHDAGVVHRDLKPDNVFLARERSSMTPKVLDFGISKLADSEKPGLLTGTGALLGTPYYMSPEQVQSARDIDSRSDQYSCGVLLYECVTGRRPVEETSIYRLIQRILAGDFAPPRQLNPSLPSAFEQLILRAMAADRDQRFPSTRAFGRALLQLASEGVRDNYAQEFADVATPDDTLVVPSPRRTLELGTTLQESVHERDPPRPVPRWRVLRLPVLGTLFLAIGLSSVVGWRLLRRSSLRYPPSASDSPVAHGAAAVAPNDLSPTPSASSEPQASAIIAAQAAYSEGIGALRGSDWPRAGAAFRRALDLDGECAPAAVQLLLMMRSMPNDQRIEHYRGLYRFAEARRSRLTPREAALLDAVQPLVMREPGDADEMHRRLGAVARAFPKDVESVFLAATMETSPDAKLAGSERVLAIDPDHLDAMQLRARALTQLGRAEEALDQLKTCVDRSPAAQCASDRVVGLDNLGQCAAAQSAAHEYVAATAGTTEAYFYLAIALAGNGAPSLSVEEAIHQEGRVNEPDVAAYLEPMLLAKLDLSRGHFASAERRGRALLSAIDGRPDMKPHDEAARILGQVLSEVGTPKQVAAVANPFFERRPVWSVGTDTGRGALALIIALDESGAIAHADALSRARAWQEDWLSRSRQPQIVSLLGSLVGRTKDEVLAFMGLDSPLRFDLFQPTALLGLSSAGHFALVAGDPDLAIARLEDVTRSCAVLVDPFLWVRAHLWLGQAYESRGTVSLACNAYGVVLDRWGVEKPLGRTASDAKKRRDALKCN